MKKRTFWQKAGDFLNGKGFYMVLVVCLCAIGVSGWYLWQTVQLANGSASEAVSGKATVTITEDADEVPPEVDAATGADAGSADSQATISAGDSTAEPALADATQDLEEDAAATAKTEAPSADSAQAEKTVSDQTEATQTSTDNEQPAQETSADVEVSVETSVETVDNLYQTMQYPVPGSVISAFSADTLTYNEALEDWRTHNGTDLSAEVGDTVVAAWDGKVLSVQQDAVLGTVVTVDCGEGYTTIYGNLAEATAVSAGDSLSAGDTIGTVGDTAAGESNGGAAFLHFAVTKDGQYLDPMSFLEADK